ncbi:Hypothetical predicted protein [Mytilus galloprovincialis]|uniref:Reverse transcriptase RNase H-like domain-containing protein n=1 Tax=Mytilus galloprovincialis TaxID=29158 RepID=A0A8B6GWI4_MYTGA|nr:Hypothetical predicted protein [Mytilus galloprovincialis]
MPNILTKADSRVPIILNNLTDKSISLKKNRFIGTAMEICGVIDEEGVIMRTEISKRSQQPSSQKSAAPVLVLRRLGRSGTVLITELNSIIEKTIPIPEIETCIDTLRCTCQLSYISNIRSKGKSSRYRCLQPTIAPDSLQVIGGKEYEYFASRVLAPAQRKYCTQERTVSDCNLQTIQEYLLGQQFIIRTDHNSLTWLLRFKMIEELARFGFNIKSRSEQETQGSLAGTLCSNQSIVPVLYEITSRKKEMVIHHDRIKQCDDEIVHLDKETSKPSVWSVCSEGNMDSRKEENELLMTGIMSEEELDYEEEENQDHLTEPKRQIAIRGEATNVRLRHRECDICFHTFTNPRRHTIQTHLPWYVAPETACWICGTQEQTAIS